MKSGIYAVAGHYQYQEYSNHDKPLELVHIEKQWANTISIFLLNQMLFLMEDSKHNDKVLCLYTM